MKISLYTLVLALSIFFVTACSTDESVMDSPVEAEQQAKGSNSGSVLAEGHDRGRLRGRVKTASGSGIADASILVQGDQSYQTTSDLNGDFDLDPMEEGSYTVTIEHSSYNTLQTNQVVTGETLQDYHLN